MDQEGNWICPVCGTRNPLSQSTCWRVNQHQAIIAYKRQQKKRSFKTAIYVILTIAIIIALFAGLTTTIVDYCYAKRLESIRNGAQYGLLPDSYRFICDVIFYAAFPLFLVAWCAEAITSEDSFLFQFILLLFLFGISFVTARFFTWRIVLLYVLIGLVSSWWSNRNVTISDSEYDSSTQIEDEREEEPSMESKLIKTVLAIELIKDLTGYGDDDWSSVDDDEW